MMTSTVSPPVAAAPGNTPKTNPRGNTEISLKLDSTLERSHTMIKKPLPKIGKSHTMDVANCNDFLPDEVMLALTHNHESEPKTAIPRERSLAVSNSAAKRPPANVWNHKRRDKYKHLTDQALCFCGAGRDISFLYDVPSTSETKPEEIVKYDPSKPRDAKPEPQPLQLSKSVLPEEYHIVKSKGVLGLEYHKDEYTTQPDDHEAHLTVFPSLKPTSRFEVMRLKEVLDNLMDKSGINDEEVESLGPTQMHNLVELIKKEQTIYNMVFHELIRQATVECTERGQLLAEIRQKYSDLLSKVPKQIRGLHDEVMAQRSLDRRLTDELYRFKEQIVILTEELTEVKEHDTLVTEQAKRAQDDLRSALHESQKNASLLGEYHELYELQRSRLEKLVSILTEEKELWSTATYSLSIKVIEEGNLVTSRRAYIAEKAWSKLAHHFTVLLSDKDTEVLTRLQGHMEKWRDLMESFHLEVKQMEEQVEIAMLAVKVQIKGCIEDFKKNCLNREGAFVKGPNLEKTKSVLSLIRNWALSVQNEIDKFSGNTLLNNNDMLTAIEQEIVGWTDCGVEVFGRHKQGNEFPNDYKVMVALNKKLREMCQQYSNRVTGENGTAKILIHLNTAFESWENKLVTLIHSGKNVPQRDWMMFMEHLDEWMTVVDNLIIVLGSVELDDGKEQKNNEIPAAIDVHEMMRKAHMWGVTTNNSIDSEDSKYVEQVTQLHTQMVKWMVNVLLRLAPDLPDTSKEGIAQSLVNSPPIPDLVDEAWLLFGRLDSFSLLIHRSCEDIVRQRAQDRASSGAEDPEKELHDLQGLKYEAYHWIYAALIMLQELTGELKEYKPMDVKFDMKQISKARTVEDDDDAETIGRDDTDLSTAQPEPLPPTPKPTTPSSPPPSSDAGEAEDNFDEVGEAKVDSATAKRKAGGSKEIIEVEVEAELPPSAPSPTTSKTTAEEPVDTEEKTPSRPPSAGHTPVPPPQKSPEEENFSRIEVIGRDDNTRPALLPEPSPDEPPPRPSSGKPMAVDSQKAYDALKTVQKLQIQLLETEQRAQDAEQREAEKQKELIDVKSQIRTLQKIINELKGEPTPEPEAEPEAAKAAEPQPVMESNEAADEQVNQPDESPKDPKKKKKSAKTSSKTKK